MAFVLGACNSGEKKKESLTVFFTGDVMFDRGVRKEMEHGSASIFEKIKPLISDGDFTVANLECPVTKRNTPANRKVTFRADPDCLTAARKAGITHFFLANEHAIDQGRQGLKETYSNLISKTIIPIGVGDKQKIACEPEVIKKGGIAVALFSSLLLTADVTGFSKDTSGICQASIEELATNIADYKKKNTDAYIVVLLHWGAEMQTRPTQNQRAQAHQLIDAGADVIIGHHPHVVQETETYKGKKIFYSLGNLIYDQSAPADEGLVIRLKFDKLGIDAKPYPVKINNCTPEPVD